jgi:hypothetical protein
VPAGRQSWLGALDLLFGFSSRTRRTRRSGFWLVAGVDAKLECCVIFPVFFSLTRIQKIMNDCALNVLK